MSESMSNQPVSPEPPELFTRYLTALKASYHDNGYVSVAREVYDILSRHHSQQVEALRTALQALLDHSMSEFRSDDEYALWLREGIAAALKAAKEGK